MPRVDHPVEARRITPEGRHFFFGYYDREPFDSTGRYHLALSPAFIDRPNTAEDPAELGVIDLEAGNEWVSLDWSAAWNWQMGASARWLGSDPARKIIYNARAGERAFARILDVPTRWAAEAAVAIFDVADDGSWGVAVNFGRIHACRPGYGYPGVPDPCEGVNASDEDGLTRVDLATGETELIVSLAQCAANRPEGSMAGNDHWFNHVMISPGGARIMFLHRWRHREWWETRLYACRADGSELKLVNPGPKVSHCDWRDDDTILSWCCWGDEPPAYRLHDVAGGSVEVVGEGLFESDGHCHYRTTPGGPDPRWFVTDTYPDGDSMRTLVLYDCRTRTRYDIGRFHSPEPYRGEIRCDLHPRWDPTGRIVSIDSLHEGYRGIYLLDVGELLDGTEG